MERGPQLLACSSIAAGCAHWTMGSLVVCSVAAKVTMAFPGSPGGQTAVIEPAPLIWGDRYRVGDTHPSAADDWILDQGDELVPVRPRADVLLQGTATPWRAGQAADINVRLGIREADSWLIDKRMRVVGRRNDAGQIAPAVATPLRYEYAAAGEDNPVGIPAQAAERPTIVRHDGAEQPIGVGPIAPIWPARKALADQQALEAMAEGHYPLALNEAFFQMAPADQQLRHLRGDEWILLQGLDAEVPVIEFALPGLRVRAQIIRTPGALPEPLEMLADTLIIDADRRRCHLVWRTQLVLSEQALRASCVELRLHSDAPTPSEALRDVSAGQTMDFPNITAGRSVLPWERRTGSPPPSVDPTRAALPPWLADALADEEHITDEMDTARTEDTGAPGDATTSSARPGTTAVDLDAAAADSTDEMPAIPFPDADPTP